MRGASGSLKENLLTLKNIKMGLGSFLKEVGEKIFGGGETPAEQAQKVKDHVSKYGFDLSGLRFSVALSHFVD